MRRELSIYLDLLRVVAAFAVFLSHLSWVKLSGGALWQLQPYGHDGVIVFFVLSGFVIQYITTQKEKSLYDYSIARLARLYSVVLPALLLTVVCDAIGQAVNPDVYFMERQSAPLLTVFAGALFLSQSWGWDLTMLSNTAYWSLPYEFWYYQIFGAALFLSGRQRVFWVAVGCLAAGPSILMYFPIWLFGAAAFLASEKMRIGKRTAWAVFAATGLAIAGLLVLEGREMIPRATSSYLPPKFSPVDFAAGALVALNLYAASFLALPLRRLGKPIAFVAGFTFSLYLFHMPLLHVVATLVPSEWPIGLRGLCVGGITLVAVFALGLLTEHKKQQFALAFAWVFERLIKRQPAR